MKTADLIARLDRASIADKMYERPMDWDEAREIATRLATLEAEAAALRADNTRKDELLTAAVDDYNEALANKAIYREALERIASSPLADSRSSARPEIGWEGFPGFKAIARATLAKEGQGHD